eukprot:5443297-Pleurochrysis_carterae.AAC.1
MAYFAIDACQSTLIAASATRDLTFVNRGRYLRICLFCKGMAENVWRYVLSIRQCADSGPPIVSDRALVGSLPETRPPSLSGVELIDTFYSSDSTLFSHRTVARVDPGGVLGARKKLAWFLKGSFSPTAWCREPSLGRAVQILNSIVGWTMHKWEHLIAILPATNGTMRRNYRTT